MIRNKPLFYILSFTWGLPMTMIGCVVAALLLITGHKPKKWGYCYYFEIGHGWGGINLGMFFLVSNTAGYSTKSHELGHAMQNCIFGALMPFLVGIPSVTRYWYRDYLVRSGKKKYYELSDYDSVWYEGGASKTGAEFMNWYNTQQNY